MTHAMEHCQLPWWKRPPVWFIAIAAVLALLISVGTKIQTTGKYAATPYGAFLDQLEAGNVASITIQGTEIRGRFKRPLNGAQQNTFSTRVPDFGDPSLIPELRKQHVVIDVTSPSAWTWLLGRVPWPMLIFVGAMLAVGFVRLVRGKKAQSESGGPAMPMHGMIGLLSGLFEKKPPPAASPPTHDSDEQKNR
jgi:ATP-dependent Zn protease